jgi:type II secretory pathway predicted ATPase ExeA
VGACKKLENYMQERFLVSGKAGSGKTHLVLQKFLHYVEEHKEDNVIFILPTYIPAKQIIARPDESVRTGAGYNINQSLLKKVIGRC